MFHHIWDPWKKHGSVHIHRNGQESDATKEKMEELQLDVLSSLVNPEASTKDAADVLNASQSA